MTRLGASPPLSTGDAQIDQAIQILLTGERHGHRKDFA